MEEIWRPIKNYEGLYEVSNLGRVKSLNYRRTGKEEILKNTKNKNGYLVVCLFKNGNKKTFCIHRLVAEAFIPNPDNLPCVDHINTIKTKNEVTNLRWVTYEENNNNELTKEKHKGNTNSLGYKQSEEHKKKISKANKDKKRTDETKKKISKAKKGEKHSEEHIQKIAKSNSKKVYCLELDKIFNSIKEASKELNICSTNIGMVCNRKRKTAGGYTFMFYEYYLEQIA